MPQDTRTLSGRKAMADQLTREISSGNASGAPVTAKKAPSSAGSAGSAGSPSSGAAGIMAQASRAARESLAQERLSARPVAATSVTRGKDIHLPRATRSLSRR